MDGWHRVDPADVPDEGRVRGVVVGGRSVALSRCGVTTYPVDVLVETLVAWGVRAVFGMVGHSNLGFADALRRAEERGELTYVGIRHEGAAAFAASAYGKLTGLPPNSAAPPASGSPTTPNSTRP